jgi:hypothetical protein
VTLTAATGGGGQHLFFAHPGVEVRNTAGRLPGVAEPLPGLDLRGDGGYVVAAPSWHASGGAYRWDPSVPLTASPGWLRPAPRKVFPTGGPFRPAPERGGPRYGLAALRAELADVRTAPVGDRSNRLNRAAFSLGMLAVGGELDRAHVGADTGQVLDHVQLHRQPNAFIFPTVDSALRYCANGRVDAIEERDIEGSHRPALLARTAEPIGEIIAREGVFRVPKDAGSFLATVEA